MEKNKKFIELNYWRKRCELAEKMVVLEQKDGFQMINMNYEAHEEWKTFIEENENIVDEIPTINYDYVEGKGGIVSGKDIPIEIKMVDSDGTFKTFICQTDFELKDDKETDSITEIF